MSSITNPGPNEDALPVSDTIECSLGCAKCGHDLYRLKLEGVCPKCNTPVRAHLPDGDRLYIRGLDSVVAARVASRASWLAFMLVIFILVPIAVTFATLNVLHFDLSFFLILVAPLVGALTIGLVVGLYKARRFTHASRWIVGDGGIARRSAGELPDVLIQRDEITRIDRSRRSLTIHAKAGRRIIMVPAEIDAFEQIHRHVARWGEIRQPRLILPVLRLALVCLVGGPGVIVCFLSRNLVWVAASGISVLVFLVWFEWTVRSSTLPRRRSVFQLVSLVLAAWIMVRLLGVWT